jgi:bifunctional non-homologous end joining protein LigD
VSKARTATPLAALRARLDALGALRREVGPTSQALMLATLVEQPVSGKDWLFEIKYDGVRILAHRAGGQVALFGRHGQDFTRKYPEIVEALEALPLDRFLLDGEVVTLDENGRPSFQRLQSRMHLTHPADIAQVRRTVPVSAVFFDALALDGRDLRDVPLIERKACLILVGPGGDGPLRYGDHVLEHGEAFLAEACRQQLEGIVAKKRESRYVGGRSRDWLKIKCQLRQEFVIGGYTDPQGTRGYFGALHLGLYESGRLVYVAKVGTGFDAKTLGLVWDRLRGLSRPTSPFVAGTPAGRGHHWVEPRLVCEVRFTEWTADGGIRHPAFLGMRDDKRPEECVRERPTSPPAPAPPSASATGSASPTVTITNPEKIFFPDDGLTKADLVGYYETVAPWLLPYLTDRPVVLTRYPDGITGKSFYQKDAPDSVPAWVRRVAIRAQQPARDIRYIVADELPTLRYVVNLGTIPLHLWASRAATLDHPDWLVLDLDPKGAPFADVVKVALALHRLFDRLELPSYVKTSGKTGLHILLPLGARYSYDEARTFARLLAALGVDALPQLATVERSLTDRGGKVYIDWGQNGPGQTIVAPLAVRPLPGAPVSCPLRWSEVTSRLDPRRFTVRTMPARLSEIGDPMAPVLRESIDLVGALQRVKRVFGEQPRRRR